MSTEFRSSTSDEKAMLRRSVRERLRGLRDEAWTTGAAQVTDRIRSHRSWRTAGVIGGYVALKDEVDLSGVLRQALSGGRRVAVPAFDPGTGLYAYREIRDWDADLLPGKYGIGEPGAECPVVPVTSLDFVLVPGIAFDVLGGRLGRGKGFYDRLLSQTVGVTCGVGLDEQFLSRVPVEAHDIRMNLIALPGNLHEVRAMG